VRFLTPTENKRLNELIGFLCITMAVLLGLALISYSPHDPAFNVSAASVGENVGCIGGRERGAELDRAGGVVYGRSEFSVIRICCVFVAGGVGDIGVPLVPGPSN